MNLFNKIFKKRYSKSERLIYVIIFLWLIFGILGLMYNTSLTSLSAYYVSLTVFIATYLWGEHKRTSENTSIFHKGQSSSREVVIYITVLLWCVAGMYGIIKEKDLIELTTYFASLTPFVSSYIIYKSSKGNDLPIFKNNNEQKSVEQKPTENEQTTIKVDNENEQTSLSI